MSKHCPSRISTLLQVKYHKDVLSFIDCVKILGNPFLAIGQQLVTLDTRKEIEQVVTSLGKIREVGQAKYTDYISQRLEKRTIPLSETIVRNKLFTFANRPDLKKGKKT